jgi:recombination protein RecA
LCHDGTDEAAGLDQPFDIMYNKGISKAGDVLDLGATMGIVENRGAFYSFEGMRLGQGRENAKEFLENSPDIASRIEKTIRDTAAMGPVASMIAPPTTEEDDEE